MCRGIHKNRFFFTYSIHSRWKWLISIISLQCAMKPKLYSTVFNQHYSPSPQTCTHTHTTKKMRNNCTLAKTKTDEKNNDHEIITRVYGFLCVRVYLVALILLGSQLCKCISLSLSKPTNGMYLKLHGLLVAVFQYEFPFCYCILFGGSFFFVS